MPADPSVKALPDLEPLLTDWEVSVIEDRLRKKLRYVPDQTRFVTYVQEATDIKREDGKITPQSKLAVFACISPHPTSPWAPNILTYGSATLADFQEARDEQAHYVKGSAENPAMKIFLAVLRNHISTLNTIRDIIH